MVEEEELVEKIFNFLSCTEQQTLSFIQEVLDDIKLFDEKQRDYGPGNIAAFGEIGVLVRANDKVARLINLLWTRPSHDEEPTNESIKDSWQDLSVYGVIARLVRKGKWLTGPQK